MAEPDKNERLAQQLRANLQKRKHQERARDALRSGEKAKDVSRPDHPDGALLPDHQKLDEG